MLQTETQNLPKLYSRRSDSKIQTWQVEIDGGRYRFHSGIEDGAIVASEWTAAKPKNVNAKNATTIEQQAIKEAQAHWQKKIDGGYKVDVKDIDVQTTFWPMLAADYKKQTKALTFPVFTQRKYDGMRCIARSTGLWSREGKPILSAPHIVAALKPLFFADPQLILDGELYADKFVDDFNQIMSMARKAEKSLTPEVLAFNAAHLQYHVYDLPSCLGTFSQRYEKLAYHVGYVNQPVIILADTVQAANQEQLDTLYGQWLTEGYEGQMVRLDALYEQKRSKHLLKRKEFQDVEFVIVDILEGEGNRSGMAGAIKFKTDKGVSFQSSIKGDRRFFQDLLANKAKYIGLPATVKFQNWTPGLESRPRFPCVTKIRFD